MLPLPKKTKKTLEIMSVILKAADEGRYLNWEEIINIVGPKYGATRGCVKNTMDRLAKSEIIAKKIVDRRVIYIPTTRAYQIYRGFF